MTRPEASELATPPLPAGAVDTHVHVFDPSRFSYDAARRYTPPPATLQALSAVHAGLGIARTVLVQPSVYAADNAALLDALAQLGSARARGIAVVDPTTVGDAVLDALHDGGVRGSRLNLKVQPGTGLNEAAHALRLAAARVQRADWCLQVHGGPALLPLLGSLLPGLRGPLVLDHFAGLGPNDCTPQGDSAALAALYRLLDSGRVWVKLSAPYRVSTASPPHDDLLPLMRALLRAAPERLLWASDWPHTGGDGTRGADPSRAEPFRPVGLPALLRALWRATDGDARAWRRVLADNPAALYGFAPLPDDKAATR